MTTTVPMLPSSMARPEVLGGQEVATRRYYPPANGAPGGASIALGVVYQVPEGDVAPLQSRGWIRLPGSGTTAQRLASINGARLDLAIGVVWADSDLGKTVIHDGSVWRDVATGTAV